MKEIPEIARQELKKLLNGNKNFIARKHTLWVEEYLLNNSKIIKYAVDENKLYIAKCHFDHNTGEVKII